MPDPVTPDVLDDIEKQIDQLLAQDPAKVQRLHDFLSKLRKVQPILDVILKLIAAGR